MGVGAKDNPDIGLVLLSRDCCVIGINKQALKLLDIDDSCLGEGLLLGSHFVRHAWINNLVEQGCCESGECSPVIRVHILNKEITASLSVVESGMEERPIFAVALMDSPRQRASDEGKKKAYKERHKIAVRDGRLFRMIDIRSVYFIKSEGNYCAVFTEGHNYFKRMTLKRIRDQNKEGPLLQVHKSYLINIDHASGIRVNKDGGALLEFSSPSIPSVPIAKRRLKDLRNILSAGKS